MTWQCCRGEACLARRWTDGRNRDASLWRLAATVGAFCERPSPARARNAHDSGACQNVRRGGECPPDVLQRTPERDRMLSLLSRIILLADRPDLAAAWAELHWREWGTEPGREELSWWIADARRALHRERVPVAFLTLGADDTVLGGVSLHPFDLEERRDRSPWIVGMIVRPELRGQGIGHALIAALETWAKQAGI